MELEHLLESAITCFHCGDTVPEDSGVLQDGKHFCCAGCKVVYSILSENQLCDYYALHQTPGRSSTVHDPERFAYLDDPLLEKKLLEFSDGQHGAVTLRIPQMHCSSCIWLLERLHTLDEGIVHSRADFLKKQLRVQYAEKKTSLRNVVELLASLGYEPNLSLEGKDDTSDQGARRLLYYRIGVAGFCFSNIMLLSFPEYLSSGDIDGQLRETFRFLNFFLALPVLLYASSGYFQSALRGLKKHVITIDVPIALGILILFLRSTYDILSLAGPGFFDSMSGLVFFLLVGRVFQSKTYDRLRFDRDYRSYFPLAVTVKKDRAEIAVPVASLSIGDRVIIRHDEIVPADSVLIGGDGAIDYSFVTGESRAVPTSPGTLIFAGGRQVGSAIELEVVKEVSQSYLTRLWNDVPSTESRETRLTGFANAVSKYFTAGVLLLAIVAAAMWLPVDTTRALHAVTAVLIVACPCALALASPFAFGTAHRFLGLRGVYLKSAAVVEAMSLVSTIVFDKTGTITRSRESAVRFEGVPLADAEEAAVAAVVKNSHHPLSRAIYEFLGRRATESVEEFAELPGQGVQARAFGVSVKLGTFPFVAAERTVSKQNSRPSEGPSDTIVHLAFGSVYRGSFVIGNRYREGIEELFARLRASFGLAVVSGDTDGEHSVLAQKCGETVTRLFHQSPSEKLEFVRSLQEHGASVLMVGDGLNDAGALRQSNVGIALTEDIAAFSPACDVILEAGQLPRLDMVLRLCRAARSVVIVAFALSLLYNAIGLWFALRGELSPLVAAVLMPLSSISIAAFSTGAVRLWTRTWKGD